MWAEIRKKTGRGKNRFTIREMFADERCTGVVLGLLRTTKVGARMGPRERLLEPGGGRGRREIHGLLSYALLDHFLSLCLDLSLSLLLSFSPFSFSLFLLFEFLSFCLSLFLSLSLLRGQAGRGQGESPRDMVCNRA